MKTDIILAGVGGQGILSIATIIGEAVMNEGLYIKQAEIHGMSQRGGSVESSLRISSEPIYCDLIAEGTADVNVDYVWTFRELDAVIQGFGIDIESTMPYTPTETASRDAHNFAKTAGVFTAVKNHIGDNNLEGVVIADLNKKNIAMLKGFAKTGKCPGKLVEVMSCPGGCITGPCSCSSGGEATRRFEAEVKKK